MELQHLIISEPQHQRFSGEKFKLLSPTFTFFQFLHSLPLLSRWLRCVSAHVRAAPHLSLPGGFSPLSAFHLVGTELLTLLRQRLFPIWILQFPCHYRGQRVKPWHARSEQTKGIGVFRLASRVKWSSGWSWSAAAVRCCAAGSTAVTWRCFISPKKVAATRSMPSKTVGLKSKLERECSVATVTVDLISITRHRPADQEILFLNERGCIVHL